jgi:hypothetical protein
MRTTKLILPATLTAIITIGASAAAFTSSAEPHTETTSVSAARITKVDERSSTVLGAEAKFDVAAPVLASQFAPIRAGSYRLDFRAVQVSLDFAADYWVVQENVGDMTVITDAGPMGPIGRDVILLAPSQVPEAPSGIRGWLDSNAAIVTGAPVDAGLGGYAALRFDIDRTNASDGESVEFMTTDSGESVAFEAGYDYRVWWIDDVDGAPIAVVVSSDGSSHPLLYQAETLLDTMAFSSGY